MLSSVWLWQPSSWLRQLLQERGQWRKEEGELILGLLLGYLVSCVHDRGGSKGGSRGSGKSNHPKGGGEDNGIGGHGVKTDKPPCVGICHYNRLFGIVTPAPKPRWWKGNLMIMGKLWHLSCPERFDLILYLCQGSVCGSVLPEQAEPLPGPARGPLEKGPRLGRLIPIGGSGEWRGAHKFIRSNSLKNKLGYLKLLIPTDI